MRNPHGFTLVGISSVILAVSVAGSQPTFVGPIGTQTVVEGRDATLTCLVANLGDYKVAWVHLERQMILSIHDRVISNLDRFQVTHSGLASWQLHISGVQTADGGYYMCQVNTDPLISQIGFLQVYEPPQIIDEKTTQSTVSARSRDNVTLVCEAHGVPKPTVEWRREDHQPLRVAQRTGSRLNVNRYVGADDGEKPVAVWNDPQLQLIHATRSDMGAYLCIAKNGVPPTVSKRIELFIEFKPMIWVSHQLVGGSLGSSVVLRCRTEAFPKPIVYWMKNSTRDRFIVSSANRAIRKSEVRYTTEMELRVQILSDSDFGTYMCVSKNYLGSVAGTITIYEILKTPTTTENNYDENIYEDIRADIIEQTMALPEVSNGGYMTITETYSASPNTTVRSHRPAHHSAGVPVLFLWTVFVLPLSAFIAI